jgi:hypothetical protein
MLTTDGDRGSAQMTIEKAPGAQFEVTIDGKLYSRRFREAIGNIAAEYVKRRFPDCDVVVNHLRGGQVTVAAYKADDDPR